MASHVQLPLAKIKRIAKLDPGVNLISSDGTAALAISTQLFIQAMAKQVHLRAQMNKRKTLQLRDVDESVRDVPWLEFLDEALIGWPDAAALKESEDNVQEEVTEPETETAIEETWDLHLEDTMQATIPQSEHIDTDMQVADNENLINEPEHDEVVEDSLPLTLIHQE